jgi:hypothetical protein
MFNRCCIQYKWFRAPLILLAVLALSKTASAQDPGATSSLLLQSGNINGTSLAPSNRTVVVAPGGAITGSFDVSINSSWSSADVMAMGVTPTWGTPSTSLVDLGAFATPVSGLEQTINVNLTAPTTPGTYYVIAAFRAEYTAAELMSCTNWSVGQVDWNTGYAIADWPAATINTADTAGTVLVNYLFPTGNIPEYVPATAIQIVVPAGSSPAISLSAPVTSQTVAVSGSACFPITVTGENLTGESNSVTLSTSTPNPSFTAAFSPSASCFPAVSPPVEPFTVVLTSSSPSVTVGLIVTAQVNVPTGTPTAVNVSGCLGSCAGAGSAIALNPQITVTPEDMVGVQNTLQLAGLNATSDDNCPVALFEKGEPSTECFSVQQNFWVYTGNSAYPSFWAQNVVVLWQPPASVNPSATWFAHPIFEIWAVNPETGKLLSSTFPTDCDTVISILGVPEACVQLPVYGYSFPFSWTPIGETALDPIVLGLSSTISGNVITFATTVGQTALETFTSHPSLTQLPMGTHTFISAGQVPGITPGAAVPANTLYEPQLEIVSTPKTLGGAQRTLVDFGSATSGILSSNTILAGGGPSAEVEQSPVVAFACSPTEETSTGLLWSANGAAFGPLQPLGGEGVTFVPGTGLTCSP